MNNQLGKERVFTKFKVSSADQKMFNADIVTMYITNFIDVKTIPALKAAKDGKGIYVLTLNMRGKGCKSRNLELLAKLVQQKLIMVLDFDDTVRFVVRYEGKLYTTNPMLKTEATLSIDGSDIDEVWENLIKSIGGIVIEGDNTLEEQVEIDEARVSLINKINALEAKAFKEKQPRRKKELIDEVKKLKEQLMKMGR